MPEAVDGSGLRTRKQGREAQLALAEEQDEQNDQQEQATAARVVAPTGAVRPQGQCAENEKDEKNQDDRAQHGAFLRKVT
jgi:hypothetical protein